MSSNKVQSGIIFRKERIVRIYSGDMSWATYNGDYREKHEIGNKNQCYCNLHTDSWACGTLVNYEQKCFRANGTADFGEYE